jgi:putative RNA 2'-phosphotransferase
MPVTDADKRMKNKLLSILRQKADQVPVLFFDSYGFTLVEPLLEYMRSLKGFAAVGRADLEHIVLNDVQGLFEWDGGPLIRATYGFSPARTYRGKELPPPDVLYHGTHRKLLKQVAAVGLLPIASDVIQLAARPESIGRAGSTLLILPVHARAAYDCGVPFYRAGDLWYFSEAIPPAYMELP